MPILEVDEAIRQPLPDLYEIVDGQVVDKTTGILLPSLPDLHEVVDGQITEKEMGARQLSIAFELAFHLGIFTRMEQAGHTVMEMLFELGDAGIRRRPDVAFISAGRWPADLEAPESNAWGVVPDLAVEVVSPTNTFDEIHEKTQDYFDAGVRQVWIVSTRTRTIQVYDTPTSMRQYGMNDTLTAQPVLPGFQLPIATLFSKRYA